MRLSKLTFSGTYEKQTQEMGDRVRKMLLEKLPSSFTVYPLVPCGYAKIKDKYRFKLLIKGQNPYLFSRIIEEIKGKIAFPRYIRLLIDIDPTSTFS